MRVEDIFIFVLIALAGTQQPLYTVFFTADLVYFKDI